jgi:predicted DNA-binding protein
MPERNSDQENRLIIDLPEDLAKRLKLAATRQNRSAARVVVELLDRHLPRVEVHDPRKKNIPYS